MSVSEIRSQCDRQTDGQTDRRHVITIPRFAPKCIAW